MIRERLPEITKNKQRVKRGTTEKQAEHAEIKRKVMRQEKSKQRMNKEQNIKQTDSKHGG